MVDIADSKWTEEDDGNIAPSPDGVQNGYAPKTVAPLIRGMRGAIKRQFNRINAIYTSTGTGVAYLLNPEVPLPIYTKGERLAFFANAANTGPATIDISGLGVKALLRSDGAPLTPNEIKAGAFVEVVYNGSAFNVVGYSQPTNVNVVGDLSVGGKVTANALLGNGSALTALDASSITLGTIDDARLPATLSAKTINGNLTINGAVSATGNLSVVSVAASGNVTATGDIQAGLQVKSATIATTGQIVAGSNFRAGGETGATFGSDGNVTGTAWGTNLKTYVDNKVASIDLSSRVAKTGDTMSGSLYAQKIISNGGSVQAGSDGGSRLSINYAGQFHINNTHSMTLQADGNIWTPLFGNMSDYIYNRANERGLAWRNDAIGNIMPTVAAQGAGGVGTYAFLQYDAAGANPGDQVSGGSCRWSDRDTGSPVVGYGSWRAMGWSQGARNSTLFMRYA